MGPAIWQAQTFNELAEALKQLLTEPKQRHSQGNAAVQGAARIANGMLTIAWEVLVIMVLEPALAGVLPRTQSQKLHAEASIASAASIGRTNATGSIVSESADDETDAGATE